MKIAIDLTSLSYHITGIERFALCMSEELLKADKTNQYILIFRDKVYPVYEKYIDGKRIQAKILHGNHKLLFFQIVIPMALYTVKADRYLFFAFPSPILFFNKNIYNTIHDMGRWDCPETGGIHLFYFKTTESIAIKRAKHIFTVSEFSKQRINELMNIKEDKITVTYNGIAETLVESNADFSYVKEKYKLPDKYIMFLSTLQPRKNLKLLLEAYSEIANQVDYDLVLIGRVGWNIEELLDKYKTGRRIVFTGFVDDEDVSLIYRHAMCFVFPTLYEGFGIPPVEALAMGTPVLSSDSSCMKEVLRDQAFYFRNNDKKELKDRLIKFESMLKEMPRCLDNFQIQNYSYKLSAKKVLDVINE